jgi:hypothetical protein
MLLPKALFKAACSGKTSSTASRKNRNHEKSTAFRALHTLVKPVLNELIIFITEKY